MTTSSYNAESIEVLKGLEPVQRRPGMYTDTSSPLHLAQEVIDNSVDEALAGHADKIRITLYTDGSLEVEDNGRGMPVDMHQQEGISAVELILTRLHAGGKFNQDNYQYSGGLHGVGISVVNALSTQLDVWVKRDAAEHHIAFAHGDTHSPLCVLGKVGRYNTGTRIRFYPDVSYFEQAAFPYKALIKLLRSKAILCPGLLIELTDEIRKDKQQWQYEHGLADYLAQRHETDTTHPVQPISIHWSDKKNALDMVLFWCADSPPQAQESYVNLIPTPQGGTHINGLRTGLTEAMREFCQFHQLLPKQLRIAPDDIMERCGYVLSLKLPEPQFAGQIKEKLSSRDATALVNTASKDALSLWLNQHKEEGEKIVELIRYLAERRLRNQRKTSRKKPTATGLALPGKLSDCVSNKVEETELFLVEGDSAGGSARQARDRRFQAILPLRGKILNTWEANTDQVQASQEVHNIATAIGMQPDDNAMDHLRYGKICILADADSDGAHIASLLCALFFRHFPCLVRAGCLHMALPPLYRIDCGMKVYYAATDKERDHILTTLPARRKVSIQRFKGLGEMNPGQLRETALLPASRRLIRMSLPDDEQDTIEMMDMLLAKKRAKDRKSWLERRGALAAPLS